MRTLFTPIVSLSDFKKFSIRPLSVLELMTMAAPSCSWEILKMIMLNVYYIRQSMSERILAIYF